MNFIEAKEAFERLFAEQMSQDQMREFLLEMRLDETLEAQTIAAAAEVMSSYALMLDIRADLKDSLIDIVGTGGDKSGSFNISTTTAILVASANLYVAKHGNRSITSKSGSADLLETLGIRLDLSRSQSSVMLEECGFVFMFAQNHHPSMRHIMPIRKSIDQKSIFNILGPLTNPAGVKRYLLGVFDAGFVRKMAEALLINGALKAMVVSSADGMDEISISSTTHAAILEDDQIREFEIDPLLYGIKLAPFEAILGSSAEQNASILLDIFNNRATDAQRDIVLINSAAAFISAGVARDMQDGLEIAKEMLLSGKARDKLEQIRSISSKL